MIGLRRSRRLPLLVFLALFFLLPLPMLVFGGLVPTARFAGFAVLCLAVALTEGAGGPVTGITFLMVAHTLVYTALLLITAWLSGRLLGRLSPSRALAIVLLAIAIGLTVTIGFEVYRTPLGPRPRTNLIGALS